MFARLAPCQFPDLRQQRGFTLIELVIVIILLGVLASATSQFLILGSHIYQDSTGRLTLVDNARFALERLNREVRNALPNSARTLNSGACVQFIPIIASGTYIQLPIAPEPAATDGSLVTPNNYSWQAGDHLAVYLLTPSEAYGSSPKIHPIASVTDAGNVTSNITFGSPIQFSAQSPSQRFYITNDSVTWCVNSGRLERTQSNNTVLMAQGLDQLVAPFNVEPANLTRNALVTMTLRFIHHDEEVTFHNEIQILNQP